MSSKKNKIKKIVLKAKGPLLKGKRSSSHDERVSFVTYRELDPECSYFPASAMSSVLRSNSTGIRCYTLRLGADSAITTDGSGLLQTVISNSPSSAQNWSGYAGVFDEWRILAMTVTYDPLFQAGGSTATYWAPIATVIDRSDATALTGYGLAERYESHKKTAGQRIFKRLINMASVDEAGFLPTTTTTASAWLKLYSSGNTVSLTVGRVNIVYVVQFRGLGIN